MKIKVFVLFLLLLSLSNGNVYVPGSPCPEFFNYYQSQTYEIFGAMTLNNDLSGDYHLSVKMSIPTKTNKGIYITKVTPLEDVQKGNNIEYYIHFPYNHTWPVMREVVFNNILYCTGPSYYNTEVTNLHATHNFKTTINPDVLQTSTYMPEQSRISTETSVLSKFTTNCGEIDTSLPLIKFGKPTRKGEFPWLVAMFYYDNKIKQYTFRCSSTLISKKFVITAAHCLKNDQNLLKKELIVLVLGKHNLNSWLRKAEIRDVEEIHIHPDYKTPADGDIAILQMSSEVEFTGTIRPACLWSEDRKDVKQIFGLKGRVLGWGKDENNNEIVDVARQLEMPITTNENCLRSDIRFFSVTSNRSFCAGKLDGSGPCTGDSGGGFLIERNGKWTLRGVVSVGLVDINTKSCDSRKYTVFSDVPAYTEWILSIIY